MARSWNSKVLIDWLGVRLWDSSESFRAHIVWWLNEIQDDIVNDIALPDFEFKLKKLLPTEQSLISLSPQIPDAPTTALNVGGSLVDDTAYKIYTSFVIYDDDNLNYIESEISEAGTQRTATTGNNTIDLTGIDVYDGANVSPNTIYRNIYVASKASTDSEFGEPFFLAQIKDNTTTTYSVTSEPTSTITPPSASEVDQISSTHLVFNSGERFLKRIDKNMLIRYNPSNSSVGTPSAFDFVGTDRIRLYPMLSSGATTNERTLSYSVYRRPHEVFYESGRPIDLPIAAKKALIAGVVWKSYDFRDRDGVVSKLNEYEKHKKDLLIQLTRQRGAPGYVRDVTGGFDGREI